MRPAHHVSALCSGSQSDALLQLSRDALLVVGHALLAVAPSHAAATLPPLLDVLAAPMWCDGCVTVDLAPLSRALRVAVAKVHACVGQQADAGLLVDVIDTVTSAPNVVPQFFFSHAPPTVVQIAVDPCVVVHHVPFPICYRH